MKLQNPQNFIDGVVPEGSQVAKFEVNAMMVDILSNLIYKNKVLAVIRELSCNAYDAQVTAGNPKPIIVQVPTKLEPVFAVEDEGLGIPEDKIVDIYLTYGKSTKTDSNELIGAMGIGSKSPIAYTRSSFIVRSRHAGVETEYLIFLNKEGQPEIATTRREATDKPNGLRVELGVRDEDIKAFSTNIINFFSFWKQKPTLVNGAHIVWPESKPYLEGTGWYLPETTHSLDKPISYAVMGHVAYPISLDAIPSPSAEMKLVAMNGFVIDFPLGDLAFAASREELSYDEQTCKSLEIGAQRATQELYEVIRAGADYVGTTLDVVSRMQAYIYEIQGRFGSYIAHNSGLMLIQLKNKDGKPIKKAWFERSGPTHLAVDKPSYLNILSPVMQRGGRIQLKQARKVVLMKEVPASGSWETGEGKPTVHPYTTSWFNPDLKPRRTSTGGTVMDKLYDGWAIEKTQMSVAYESARTLKRWQELEGKRIMFVLNDKGNNGSTACRAYLALISTKYELSSFYFVDFGGKRTPPDFGRAEIEEMLKDTAVEGATVIELSKLPGFKMPKVEVAPRQQKRIDPTKRGFMEVRKVIFASNGELHSVTLGKHSKSFHAFSEQKSEYTKINPAELTAVFAYSAPGGMSKALRAKLYSARTTFAMYAGLLDKYVTRTPHAGMTDDFVLEVIVRNSDDIEALRKKGAVLTNLEDVLKAIDTADCGVIQDKLDIYHMISNYGSHGYHLFSNGLLSSGVCKKLLNRVKASSFIYQVLKDLDELNTFFKDPWAIAFAGLGKLDKNKSSTKKIADRFSTLIKRYPLLTLSPSSNDVNVDSLVLYLEAEDAKHEKQAAAKRAADEAAATLAAAARQQPSTMSPVGVAAS